MKNRGMWITIAAIIAAGSLITICNTMYLKNQAAKESAVQELALDEIGSPAKGGELTETGVNAASEEELTGAPAAALAAAPEAHAFAADAGAEETQTETTVMSPLETTVMSPLETAAASDKENVVMSPLETASSVTAEAAEAPGDPDKKTVRADQTGGTVNYRTRLDELDRQIQKIRNAQTQSTTYSMKTAAENELKLWDSELNAIYNDILNYLDKEDKQMLVKEEREWMKTRDATAVEAAKKFAGGSLEGLEYTASLAESTKQRAYELAAMYEKVTE